MKYISSITIIFWSRVNVIMTSQKVHFYIQDRQCAFYRNICVYVIIRLVTYKQYKLKGTQHAARLLWWSAPITLDNNS